MSQHITSEGTSFSQRGGASNKQLPPNDKILEKYAMIQMLTERSPIRRTRQNITSARNNIITHSTGHETRTPKGNPRSAQVFKSQV